MRFTKPTWVAHYDNHEPPKRGSIFSISVHPDGSRVATGGLDAKIRIWSTNPILSAKAEAKGQPKALCTLTMHNGPVLCVRWAASGKWLASGSDDTVVMIWDLDPNGGGKVWGSDDVNIEGWKALRRLTGHQSDVVDLAWSPADRYLASVGLDNSVFIWCGYTLECIRRINAHDNFVKGVCWDPVGEYLATESDDKTVKIWRSADWGLETVIGKPFETSPGSAFYLRLSWSPDASYVCASNAMNNNVFVATVVERDTWNSNISLVGHENTIQVTAYNPHIFRRDTSIPFPSATPSRSNASPSKRSIFDTPTKRSGAGSKSMVGDTPSKDVYESVEGDEEEDQVEDISGNVFSVVALGGDDRSISIWRTIDPRPFVVVKEAFDRQILDLSWGGEGKSVWACSSDGTICVLDFSESSETWVNGVTDDASMDVVEKPPRKKELEGICTLEQTKEYIKMFDFPWPPPLEANRQPFQPSSNGHFPSQSYQSSSYSAPSFNQSPYRDDRYAPSHQTPVRPVPQTVTSPIVAGPPPPPIGQGQKVTMTKSGKKRIQPTFLGGGSAVTSSSPMPMLPPQPTAGPTTPTQASYRGHGHSSSVGGMDWAPDRGRREENGYSSSALPPPVLGASPRRHRSSGGGFASGLEVPPIQAMVSVGQPGEVILEARNGKEPSAPTEVVCAHGTTVHWVDYVPVRALNVVKTPQFFAIGLEDSTVIIYSPSGRRLMPTISLDTPPSIMAATGKFLMTITAAGMFHTWNVQTRTSTMVPSSISAQVTPVTGGITHAKIYDNGTSLITLASGISISWDPDLSAWVRLQEPWWTMPPQSHSHSRQSSYSGQRSPVTSTHPGRSGDTPLDRAIDLGSLETRLYAAKLLGSASEYKAALMAYSTRLSDDNLAERADEVVRELCGPVFWDPSRPRVDTGPPSKWEPRILGMNKRDLLKDVLPILGRNRHLTKMAQDWQVLLARIESEQDA